MSVKPTAFTRTPTSVDITVWHDEAGHGGTVAFADLTFSRNPDASVNPRFLNIPCPVCGAVSTHPIAGGATPKQIQFLFALIYRRRAVALGIPVGQRTWDAIKTRVRAAVETMDGPGRWQIDDLAEDADLVG